MINTTLSKAVEDAKPMTEATIVTRVQMNPSKLMENLAEGLMYEVERLVPYSGYKPVADLESSDILKYLKTLTWIRCQATKDVSPKEYLPYRSLSRHVEVPVLAYQLFISIGEAYDKNFAIRFLPEYQIESADLLSPEELSSLSDIFLALRTTCGFASVKGMPSSREGELDFMAMCHVEQIVRSYRNTHPVYGFLASFFAQQTLNEVTGTMCRVVYGYDTDYKLYIRSLLATLKAEPPEVRHNDT